jgi:hypothetical protein
MALRNLYIQQECSISWGWHSCGGNDASQIEWYFNFQSAYSREQKLFDERQMFNFLRTYIMGNLWEYST